MSSNVCAFCYTNDVSADEIGVCIDCLPSTFKVGGQIAIFVNRWLELRVDIAKRSLELFKGHYVVYLPEQGAEVLSCQVPENTMVSDLNWLNKDLIETVTCAECIVKLAEFDEAYREQGLKK